MTEWKRVKIGEVCRIEKGATGIASATPGDYPLVVTALERKTCSTYQFDCEAVCIPLVSSSGHGKKSLKYVHYQSGKFALGTILAAVIPNDKNELSARYLHQYLQFYKDTLIVPLMHGAANVSLAIRDIEQIEIPLPPIEKQNEFAKLFVRMQENDVELQSEFETQKDLIKKLRQSILQDAIEGKLTEDWRKENPLKIGDINFDAEALFEKIQEEKGKQEKGNKKKKDNGKLQVISDEEPFEIPKSWKWVRLGEIVENITSGSREWAKYYSTSGAIFLRMGNLSKDSYKLRLDNIQYVTPPSTAEEKRTKLLPFDLLFSITAEIGNLGLIPQDFPEAYINQHTARIRFCNTVKENLFMPNALMAPSIRKQYLPNAHGMKNSFRLDTLAFIKIPLPPLAEQNEIVRRVENQLAKVEQLEQQIEERETLTKSLFRGILKNAFEGRENL